MREIFVFGCQRAQDIKKLKGVFALLSIRVSEITPAQYDCPVGKLTGGAAERGERVSSPDGPLLPAPVMLFAGFDDPELERVLEMVGAQLPDNPYLKAVLTEHNREWNIRELVLHLIQEHLRFH